MIGKIKIETKEEDIGVEGETLMNIEIKDKTGQKETTKQNSKEEDLRMMIVNTDEQPNIICLVTYFVLY